MRSRAVSLIIPAMYHAPQDPDKQMEFVSTVVGNLLQQQLKVWSQQGENVLPKIDGVLNALKLSPTLIVDKDKTSFFLSEDSVSPDAMQRLPAWVRGTIASPTPG